MSEKPDPPIDPEEEIITKKTSVPIDEKEKPPMKKSRSSDSHKAVRYYRDKLQSIEEGVSESARKLDETLAEFLEEKKSSKPPTSE